MHTSTTLLKSTEAATARPVTQGILGCRVTALYLDGDGAWTRSSPSPLSVAYTVAPRSAAILVAGGTPNQNGGWTDGAGTSFEFQSIVDAAGDLHAVAVQVGPTSPPPDVDPTDPIL